MSWVIGDSEEEEEFETSFKPPEPQAKGHSSISDFSSRDNLYPTADKPSSISNFTTDNVVGSAGTVTDTILVPSTSAPAPAKPKRPRPRPAYKGRAEGPDSIDQSTSAASVTANAINQISPRLPRQPLLDPSFSFDIAATEHGKKEKKGKKKVGDFVLIDEAGKQDTSSPCDDAGAAELDTSVAGKVRPKAKRNRKKQRIIIISDEDEPESTSSKDNPVEMEVEKTKTKESCSENKENEALPSPRIQQQKTPTPSSSPSASAVQARPLNSKSQISTPNMPPRRDSMSALIRRVNSKVQSPLGTPSPTNVHSPLAKVSRRSVSRMAPLHPNRRTPPPAPPRPPPPKKSKKMIELEERWEMELAETVEGWSCMTDDERAALRRAKRDAELGYED